MEEWKGVAFLTHVQVSNLGRYRVFVKGRWSDPQLGSLRPDGYLTGRFNSQQYRIHRLVADVFLGPAPSPDASVDHINRDRSDNRAANLRWSTPTEQARNQCSKVRKRLHDGVEMLPGEIWRPYKAIQVSNMGRVKVRHQSSKQWMRPATPVSRSKTDGYPLVSNRIRVHRAVWVAFNGEIPEGHTVDHINHVKDDNRLENLRLATAKEQRSNQVRTGAYASTVKRRVEGRPLGSHDWQQFKSQKHAAATLTAQHNTMFRNDMISRVCVRNRGTTNGWEFRFVPD